MITVLQGVIRLTWQFRTVSESPVNQELHLSRVSLKNTESQRSSQQNIFKGPSKARVKPASHVTGGRFQTYGWKSSRESNFVFILGDIKQNLASAEASPFWSTGMGLVITWLIAVDGVLTVLWAHPTPPSSARCFTEKPLLAFSREENCFLSNSYGKGIQLAMPSHSKSVPFYFRHCVCSWVFPLSVYSFPCSVLEFLLCSMVHSYCVEVVSY